MPFPRIGSHPCSYSNRFSNYSELEKIGSFFFLTSKFLSMRQLIKMAKKKKGRKWQKF